MLVLLNKESKGTSVAENAASKLVSKNVVLEERALASFVAVVAKLVTGNAVVSSINVPKLCTSSSMSSLKLWWWLLKKVLAAF